MTQDRVQQRTFIILLILVTVAFIAILMPFAAPVLWAAIFAIVFYPLQARMRRWLPRRQNVATLMTLLICIVVGIVPLIVFTRSLYKEGVALFELIQSGRLDFGRFVDRVSDAAPWVREYAAEYGFELNEFRSWLRNSVSQLSGLVAKNALNIGQVSFMFVVKFGVMLYMLFFLLRDGPRLARGIRQAIPLSDQHKTRLFQKFGEVVRATMKGNVLVALVQGSLGGLIFWILGIQGALLWGSIMVVLSLLPAVGAALIWAPVALYFLLTGSTMEGIILAAFGVGVIGLVDNLMRPWLVGQETQLPDYLILISTLGGITLLGMSGFVLGPLVAAFFIAVWDLSLSEFNRDAPPATDLVLPPEYGPIDGAPEVPAADSPRAPESSPPSPPA